MTVPHAVVEAKLHLLFHVAREIVGGDPAGVNIEGRLSTVRVVIDDPHLDRVPGVGIGRAHQASLPGGRHAVEPSAEGEIDQFEVMHGHVRAGVAAADPLGKLLTRDLFGLQQRTVSVIDVLQFSVDHQRAKAFVIGIEQLVIDHFGQHLPAPRPSAGADRVPPGRAPTVFRSGRVCRPRVPGEPRRSADRRALRRTRNRHRCRVVAARHPVHRSFENPRSVPRPNGDTFPRGGRSAWPQRSGWTSSTPNRRSYKPRCRTDSRNGRYVSSKIIPMPTMPARKLCEWTVVCEAAVCGAAESGSRIGVHALEDTAIGKGLPASHGRGVPNGSQFAWDSAPLRQLAWRFENTASEKSHSCSFRRRQPRPFVSIALWSRESPHV